MAITKAEFKQAFREVMSLEFSHIPTDENSIQYTFSKKFNRRMEKLIKSQKKFYWNFINTASKKVAVICLTIITLFTASLSVEAIRKPVVNFITEIYETFTKYFFEGDTVDTLKKEYIVKKLPQGFKETNVIENDISKIVIYENQNGDIIEFMQAITTDAQITIDSENTNNYTQKIGNKDIFINVLKDNKQLKWIENEYYFEIIAYGDIMIEDLIEIVKTIE